MCNDEAQSLSVAVSELLETADINTLALLLPRRDLLQCRTLRAENPPPGLAGWAVPEVPPLLAAEPPTQGRNSTTTQRVQRQTNFVIHAMQWNLYN